MLGGTYLINANIARNWYITAMGACIVIAALILASRVMNTGWNGADDFIRLYRWSGIGRYQLVQKMVARYTRQPEPEVLPLRWKINLEITSFAFFFVVAVLAMFEHVNGMRIFGHTTLDVVMYVFVALGALTYFMIYVLKFILYMWRRRRRLSDKGD